MHSIKALLFVILLLPIPAYSLAYLKPSVSANTSARSDGFMEVPAIATAPCSSDVIQQKAADVIRSNIVDCTLQAGQQCFRAGGFWNQFWVRDTSYSSLMGLWRLYPKQLKNTFIELVLQNGKKGYPAQDSATDFGAFPYQTDSVLWVIGAFEVAKNTNDEEFRKYVYETGEKMRKEWLKAYDLNDGLIFGAASFLDSWASYPPEWQGQKYRFQENKFLSTNVLWLRFNEILLFEGKRLGRLSETEFEQRKQETGKTLQHLNGDFYSFEKGYYTYYTRSDRYEGVGNALMQKFHYNFYPIEHILTEERFYPALYPSFNVKVSGNWYSESDQHIWVDSLIASLVKQNSDVFCSKYSPLIQAYDDIKELIQNGNMLGGTRQLWGAVGLYFYLNEAPNI